MAAPFRGGLTKQHEELWSSLQTKEKEKALFFEDPKLIERAYNMTQELFVRDCQYQGTRSEGAVRERLVDAFEWAWHEERQRPFPVSVTMKREFLRRKDFLTILYSRLGAQPIPKDERRAVKQKGKLINRAAAARAWVALFERNANSWIEFDTMLARLTFAAITQKCLEVEAAREEEERQAKAMTWESDEHQLLEELLAESSEKASKKKKKKKPAKKEAKEPEPMSSDPESRDEHLVAEDVATPRTATTTADEDAHEEGAARGVQASPAPAPEPAPAPAHVRTPSATTDDMREHVRTPSATTDDRTDAETVPQLERNRAAQAPEPVGADDWCTVGQKGKKGKKTRAAGTAEVAELRASSPSAAKPEPPPAKLAKASPPAKSVAPAAQAHVETAQASPAPGRAQRPNPRLEKSSPGSASTRAPTPAVAPLPWSPGVRFGAPFWAFKGRGACSPAGCEPLLLARMQRTFLYVGPLHGARQRRSSI